MYNPKDTQQSKDVESALIESEQRFRQMAELSGEWLWEQDPEGYYLYSSSAVKQILGFSQEQIIGKHYTELLTSQDKQAMTVYSNNQHAFNTLINHYRHKDGHPVITESNGLPITDAQGKLLKWRGVDRDITAKIHFQDALIEAERQNHQAQVELALKQKEIDIAQQIQASLAPAEPIKTNNFEITGICLPANNVGGDYYDYFFRTAEQLEIVIADVSGHSIGAGLYMVETRSALRTQNNPAVSPAQTLRNLNNFLFADLNKSDYFITLFYLQVDIAHQQISYANAGHPPPLLLNGSQGTVQELDADGLVLGVKQNIEFTEKTAKLAAGDIILFYTDGLIEAENSAQEFFGLERVKTILQQNSHLPAQGIVDTLFTALQHFCAASNFADDITLMVFKWS